MIVNEDGKSKKLGKFWLLEGARSVAWDDGGQCLPLVPRNILETILSFLRDPAQVVQFLKLDCRGRGDFRGCKGSAFSAMSGIVCLRSEERPEAAGGMNIFADALYEYDQGMNVGLTESLLDDWSTGILPTQHETGRIMWTAKSCRTRFMATFIHTSGTLLMVALRITPGASKTGLTLDVWHKQLKDVPMDEVLARMLRGENSEAWVRTCDGQATSVDDMVRVMRSLTQDNV